MFLCRISSIFGLLVFSVCGCALCVWLCVCVCVCVCGCGCGCGCVSGRQGWSQSVPVLLKGCGVVEGGIGQFWVL